MATRQAYVLIDGVWTLTGGPPGPQGPQGPAGPPGTSTAVSLTGHAAFDYTTTTAEFTTAPAGGMRLNTLSPATTTKIWVSHITRDGMDVTVGLERITAGGEVYIQDYDDPTRWAIFFVSATSIYKTSYFEIPVVYRSSSPTNITTAAGPVELMRINPASVGIPIGGSTNQVLAKSSGSDYAVSWVAQSGGGSAGHTIMEEGTGLTPRANLNFKGPAVTVTDDSVTLKTDVTVSTPNILVLGPTDPVPGGTPSGTIILRTP